MPAHAQLGTQRVGWTNTMDIKGFSYTLIARHQGFGRTFIETLYSHAQAVMR
jgi:hypothetical protein